MITLTEKRLQELEGRIPVYEAMIAELKKKLDEVNTFPKDILDTKECLKVFRQDLDHLYNSSNHKLNDLIANSGKVQGHLTAHSEALSSHQGLIDSLNSTIDMVHNKVKGHIAEVDNLHIIQRTLLENCQALDKKVLDHQNALNSITQRNNEIYSKANNAQIDATAALNKTVEHEKAFAMNADDKQRMFKHFNDRINLSMVELEQRLKPVESVQPKSYDAEIAEIRKDIAIILTVVHSTATQAPDNSQVNDKIKTMEQAIAQIYSLLKKYEQR